MPVKSHSRDIWTVSSICFNFQIAQRGQAVGLDNFEGPFQLLMCSIFNSNYVIPQKMKEIEN